MLTLLTTLGTEPVSVAEASAAARLDGDAATELAGYVAGAITAARQQAELITGRHYVRKTLRQQLHDWPCPHEPIPVHAANACVLSYWTGSAWATLDTSAYVYAPSCSGTGTVLAAALNTTWPLLGLVAAGPRVRVDLTAGPTGADGEPPVPECVKLYIKASVAGWVNSPDSLIRAAMQPNPMLQRLLDGETLWG